MLDRVTDCFWIVRDMAMIKNIRAAIIMTLVFVSHPFEAWKAYKKFKKMLPPR